MFNTNIITTFKYRSLESAKRCLDDGTLFFATPSSLNDTLEAQYEHASAEDFSKVILETYSKISAQRQNSHLTFSAPDEVLKELKEYNDQENKRLKKFTDNIGIFSAAKRPNHQAMWAYYANDYKGVCFELQWSKQLLEKHQIIPIENMQYSENTRVHNRADDWQIMFNMLANDYPNATLDELHQLSFEEKNRRLWGLLTASRPASIKHPDWAHEDEVRLLKPKAGALPVLEETLKAIHTVTKNDLIINDTEKEMLNIIIQKYPSVKIVRWHFHHGLISPSCSELKAIPLT